MHKRKKSWQDYCDEAMEWFFTLAPWWIVWLVICEFYF